MNFEKFPKLGKIDFAKIKKITVIEITTVAIVFVALSIYWYPHFFNNKDVMAAAKIKAIGATRQVTYGEGTVELLEGGSHASGHDIDLGTKPDGTRRRAEGGEFFAVINKRNSRRFRNVIPDVINAFNDGSFADRYQKANATMSAYAVNMGGTDISKLEKDVAAIRRQGDESRFVDGNGNIVTKYKNLTRRVMR